MGKLADTAFEIASKQRRRQFIRIGDRYQNKKRELSELGQKKQAGPKGGEDRIYTEEWVFNSPSGDEDETTED